jgi:cytoskeleton protein RodZ
MTELVEPVGRKLAKAREARGLTLEEAALETRIRPPQIAALEADDYSSFASNTYARGFLLIYGRFLGVDVREVARGLESGNPISIAEYQYLNAYPEVEPERSAPTRREQPTSRRPSIAPLIVFVLMLAGAGLGLHLYLQAQRLETADSKTPSSNVENVAPHSASGATPAPGTATTSITAPGATPAARAVPLQANPTPAPLANRPGDADRAFVTNPPVAGATPAAPAATLPQVNELVVEPLKKTWVRIRRDDPNAEPIFDDVLYPKVGALKLKGAKFFLDIREPDAVALRKNGQPLAYQPPGITIQ